MDLISRQAAIDHWRLIIDATSMDSRYDMGFVDGLEFCINHLSTMPSIDAVDRRALAETIKHYAQYPDGMSRLLEVYGADMGERRTDEQTDRH